MTGHETDRPRPQLSGYTVLAVAPAIPTGVLAAVFTVAAAGHVAGPAGVIILSLTAATFVVAGVAIYRSRRR